MAGRASKAKGYRGEVEVMSLMQGVVNEVYAQRGLPPPELTRSPSGRDIVGIRFIAPEVKRHERENPFVVTEWWTQCKTNAVGGREPVLFYRPNHAPWTVKMFGKLLFDGDRGVRCPVDIGMSEFLLWFRHRLSTELDQAAKAKVG